MYQSKICSQLETEVCLPRMSNVVQSYVSAAARMINSPVDFTNLGMPLIRSGCLSLPQANIAITGTSCSAPLVQTEAQLFADMLQCNMLLMRCEGRNGVSFDIYQPQGGHWRTAYQFWAKDCDLWLIPQQASQPYFNVTKGFAAQMDFPFTDSGTRQEGLDHADSLFSSHVRRSI